MPTTSQGASFGGITGLTSISVKTSSKDADPSSNLVDVSTLDTVQFREYATAPLVDAGAGSVDGETCEVSITFLGSGGGISLGQSVSSGGFSMKCTDLTIDSKVGEFVSGSATFKSVGEAE